MVSISLCSKIQTEVSGTCAVSYNPEALPLSQPPPTLAARGEIFPRGTKEPGMLAPDKEHLFCIVKNTKALKFWSAQWRVPPGSLCLRLTSARLLQDAAAAAARLEASPMETSGLVKSLCCCCHFAAQHFNYPRSQEPHYSTFIFGTAGNRIKKKKV